MLTQTLERKSVVFHATENLNKKLRNKQNYAFLAHFMNSFSSRTTRFLVRAFTRTFLSVVMRSTSVLSLRTSCITFSVLCWFCRAIAVDNILSSLDRLSSSSKENMEELKIDPLVVAHLTWLLFWINSMDFLAKVDTSSKWWMFFFFKEEDVLVLALNPRERPSSSLTTKNNYTMLKNEKLSVFLTNEWNNQEIVFKIICNNLQFVKGIYETVRIRD